MYHDTLSTPLGLLLLVADDRGLCSVSFEDPDRVPARSRRDPARLEAARTQLREYFEGKRERFELPLAGPAQPFASQVYAELCRVPYGQTITYGELARRIGRPGAARAVGAANRRNPHAIVVPCHRVIGCRGDLVGYVGGLDRKRHLLTLEQIRP